MTGTGKMGIKRAYRAKVVMAEVAFVGLDLVVVRRFGGDLSRRSGNGVALRDHSGGIRDHFVDISSLNESVQLLASYSRRTRPTFEVEGDR